MRTIIATIKPRHLTNIRRGAKLWEVRKTVPGLADPAPFRVLCCESGSGGEIKAEFVVNEWVEVYVSGTARDRRLCEEACISLAEAKDYVGDATERPLRFWKIEDMVDYCSTKGYKVRNISEFGLKRAPQSWQYVERDSR